MNENEPIYVRVQRELMDLLKEGDYEPGSKVPSERELSTQFGASRMTMRKAVDLLVTRGVLERRGTSGTYIPQKLFARPLSHDVPFGISEVANERGKTSGSKLLYFERQPADEEAAAKLELSVGESVILICRQRTVDDIPVCVELIQIPAKFVPGLSATDVVENTSLYELFTERYGIEHRIGDSKIGVSWLTSNEAELLDLPPDSPVLDYQCVSRLRDDAPFEFLRSINHPKYVNFHIAGSQNSNGSVQRNGVKFALVDKD